MARKKVYTSFETEQEFNEAFDKSYKAGYDKGFDDGIAYVFSYICDFHNMFYDLFTSEVTTSGENLSKLRACQETMTGKKQPTYRQLKTHDSFVKLTETNMAFKKFAEGIKSIEEKTNEEQKEES